MLIKQCVGIDVSKKDFHVCFSTIDAQQSVKVKGTRKFINSPQGFQELHIWVEKRLDQASSLVFLMEATGVYHERLARFLYEDGQVVHVVLPTKAKRYLQSLGNKSKNDRIDAKGLATMGLQQNLELWQPASNEMLEIKALTRELEALQNDRTIVRNRLEGLEHAGFLAKEVIQRTKKRIKAIEEDILAVKSAIERVIESNESLKTKFQNMTSIKGVGTIAVATIIAETDGFALFENQSQLVSYAGYDVVENQSGTFRGKSRMSKKGNSHIRRALHMPAWNVVRYDIPVFKAFYERLMEKGKRKMQAYVAIQKKLLVILWTLWRKNEPFNPEHYLTSDLDEAMPEIG